MPLQAQKIDKRLKDAEKARRYRAKHPEKVKEYAKKYNAANKSKVKYLNRRKNLLVNYGIGFREYDRLFKSQRGQCAICGAPFSLDRDAHLDHDHLTGKVRGILCKKCNTGIALLRESPLIFHSAVRYLGY